jgi:hypothetical protein
MLDILVHLGATSVLPQCCTRSCVLAPTQSRNICLYHKVYPNRRQSLGNLLMAASSFPRGVVRPSLHI